jgi:hypothetical protein
MLTKAQIEEKAREIYLSKYGEMGGRWELVETKDVWHKMAIDWFNTDEGTRMVYEGQIVPPS